MGFQKTCQNEADASVVFQKAPLSVVYERAWNVLSKRHSGLPLVICFGICIGQ